MRPIHHRCVAAAVSVLALVTGACGSDDGDDTGGAAGDAPATTLELEARDFTFAPAALTAPPGAEVTVKVRNTGAAPHTFTSEAVGVDEQVAAGESGEATFTMPESGNVAFVCTIHEAQGMTGTIDPA